MPGRHPQTTFAETVIEPDSFFGKIRQVYARQVLKTQLEQLKQQGSYDAFKLEWHPVYDVRRTKGGTGKPGDTVPPSLFWESDIGKWIEGACYFLATRQTDNLISDDDDHVFRQAIQELVDMIEKAQQSDGYLNIYFTVVDPEGKLKNLRDMHEMYNAGHLLEGALAHHQLTGSRQFLDVMIKNIDFFIHHLGHGPDQIKGYPGHPELELAILRLYAATGEDRFKRFADYLLSERGKGDGEFYRQEAKARHELVHPTNTPPGDFTYWQAHTPLLDQPTILGHSVRAFYLTTAAADLGGPYLSAAARLLDDGVQHKMYITGGFGTEPHIEGFSSIPYWLPQSTDEGGCYAETCASIACMMTCERILAHGMYNVQARDTMELCLYNAVLGGASLDGKQFAYANKLTTCGDETAIRKDWFEVCCCPPNLSRTLGMLGGYTWSVRSVNQQVIELDIYLLISATRTITGKQVKMTSEMPWTGKVSWYFESGTQWNVRAPTPAYATNIQLSVPYTACAGYIEFQTTGGTINMTFDQPVRLLSSHPRTGRSMLGIMRGPIVHTAESADNPAIEERYPHFAGLGISQDAAKQIQPHSHSIQGLELVMLSVPVCAMDGYTTGQLWQERTERWEKVEERLIMVPWFARGNQGGKGHLRTCFTKVVQ